MTRLTTELINEVSSSLDERDRDLVDKIGVTLKGLAMKAVCPSMRDLDLSHLRAAAIPMASGKGIIPTFSHSVCAIAQHMGLDCFVTNNSDVAGMAEAISAGVDILFMADDKEFIALNTRNGKYASNTNSTALGYCSVIEAALGGLSGKEVLVIGAGHVGSVAIRHMMSRGAIVKLLEADSEKASRAVREFGVTLVTDPRSGIAEAQAILNAAPVTIPGSWIKEGAVVSTPGVPYGFDAEGERRARMIVHDPLQIGVSVMTIRCASFSLSAISVPQVDPVAIEVLE
jgi:pyrrolysine biosynthesis protein PylD